MTPGNISEPFRIVVVGTAGSGKTTMAHRIAQRLAIPHIELDSLYWEPHWQGATDQVFFQRISAAVAGEQWVLDGNYTRARDISWQRARAIVWLDYSLPLVLRRVLWRTLRRLVTREKMWQGNQESLKMLLGKDSIVLWTLNTWRSNREKYEQCMQSLEYKHLAFIRLRTPGQAQDWFEQLPVRN